MNLIEEEFQNKEEKAGKNPLFADNTEKVQRYLH